MSSKSYLIIVVCFIVGFAVLCGCCSTQEQAGDTGVKATNTSPPTDSGLRIITEELPPFNYAGPDGKAAGEATDIVNEILARLNQKASIEILSWSEGYRLALAGPNVALYSTGRIDVRENLFKWVGPIADFDYTLYVRKGSGLQIGSLEAAKRDGLIGVERNSSRHQFLQENRVENVVTCDTDIECIRNLNAGATTLWLGSSSILIDVAEKAGIDPSSVEAVYTIRTVPLYIAFSTDTPDSVVARWQEALDTMKRDGTFDAIREKYGLSPSAGTPASALDEEQADLALDILSAETDGQLEAVLRPLEIIALTSEAHTGEWENIRPFLVVLEEKEPDARTWYALPNGSYYTVVDGLTSASLKDRSYFPVVLAGNETVGIVVVSHSTGKNAAIVAVPIKTQDTVTGVMGASVYLDTMTETIRAELGGKFIFYAIDTEHKFALHSDKAQISRNITTIGPDSSFGRAIDTMLTQNSGTVEYEDGGIHYEAKFQSDSLTGWRLVVAWPKSDS
jgi:polar amino acid transport system substrate-binding protein